MRFTTPPTPTAGSRNSSEDFTLASGNDYPDGIWSNGATMWVADWTDDKLYAYHTK